MSRLRLAALSQASGYATIAFTAAYGLASVPLAPHYHSKPEFGLLARVTQVASYLVWLDLSMNPAVARSLVDHKENKADGKYCAMIRTGFLAGLVQGADAHCDPYPSYRSDRDRAD